MMDSGVAWGDLGMQFWKMKLFFPILVKCKIFCIFMNNNNKKILSVICKYIRIAPWEESQRYLSKEKLSFNEWIGGKKKFVIWQNVLVKFCITQKKLAFIKIIKIFSWRELSNLGFKIYKDPFDSKTYAEWLNFRLH